MIQVAMLADAAAADGSGWLVAGFALLGTMLALGIAELFVPTAGVLAVMTALAAIGSVACFFMHSPLWGFASLLAYSAGAPFAVVLGFKLWTRTPIARRMVLGSSDEQVPGGGAPAAAGPVPVGEEGVAATPLRPVGFVRFGDRRIEAVAEHGMIEAGTAVTVAESGPARIVVRARG
jgi:membrane-bound serine protease (ClpP class)